MDITLHLHLIAAVSWIGGSVFLFVLGLTLRAREDREAVYPRIGPIYGYFELVALIVLLFSGILLTTHYGLWASLLDRQSDDSILQALRVKLLLVLIIGVMTVIHTVISFQTLHRVKGPLETLVSRGSAIGIFILNFWVLHYAMVLRDQL
jgi:uncharacterized membrane protein